MPSWYQVVGIAARELSPSLLQMWQTSQNAKSLDRTAALQNESYDRMSSVVARAPAKARACATCSIESGGRAELYRRIWDHLHSLPGTMEERPTPEDREKMEAYVSSLIQNLPCSTCSEHGRAYIAANPVDASSPEALGRFLCRYHNSVSEMRGMPVTHICE